MLMLFTAAALSSKPGTNIPAKAPPAAAAANTEKAPMIAVSANNLKTNSAVPDAKAEAMTTSTTTRRMGACGGNDPGSNKMVDATLLATPLLTAAVILHFQLQVGTHLYKYIC